MKMKLFVCFFALVAVCLGQAETEPEQICPRVCPANYDPVCCTYGDGTTKTYSNNCAAASENCLKKTSCTRTAPGACAAVPEKPCALAMCLDVYKPVCCNYADGTSQTFGNACEASNSECGGTPCESTTDGECDTFHILPVPYEPQVFVPAVMPPTEA